MKGWLFILSCMAVSALCSQETEYHHSLFNGLLENKGQWPDQVLFRSRSHGQTIWMQQHGFLFDVRDYNSLREAHIHPEQPHPDPVVPHTLVAAHFVGSNDVTQVRKTAPGPQYYNYFLGNDPAKWASGVYGYGQAVMEQFYPGIDLRLIDDASKFKYELWCQPGSHPEAIAIEYKGHTGLSLDAEGNLLIHTTLGPLKELAPVSWQLLNGKMQPVKSAFRIEGNRVLFELGKYDKNATLVIDPTLVFGTYCGSPTDNFGMTATYGYDGSAYSGGTIFGNSYPTPDPNGYDVTSNFTGVNSGGGATTDVFISRYSPDGTTMLWTSFLGGGNNTQGTETVHSLICDKQNSIYLFGVTSSLDFPIVNGYQSTHSGGSTLSILNNGTNFGTTGTDLYVAHFSANGHNLLGSTYMGGSQNDGVNYKVTSGNYQLPSSYDSLTTNYGDQFRGEIMIDSAGNCLVASCTRSADFPLQQAFQTVHGGQQDGVVFKLTNDLSTLLFSSYLGGSQNDACYSVKIDSSYHILVAGGTSSNNLPGTAGALNPSYMGGKTDGFVSKLTPNGQSLIRTSYIGTSLYDQAFFVEIDRLDNVYLLGQSFGGTYPIINATGYPNSGQFVTKLNPDLNTVLNSTVFGNGNGALNISPSAFLVDICGNMYISGWGANILLNTQLSGMPVSANAFQSTPPNGFDFYLAVLDRDFDGLLYGSYIGGNLSREHVDGGTSRFDKNGIVYQSVCGGCGGHSDFPTSNNAWSATNESSNCNNLIFKFDFELIPKAQFSTQDLTGCASFEVEFENISSPSDSYLWDFGNGDTTSIVFNPVVTYTQPGTYHVTLTVTDSVCLLTDTATIDILVTPAIQLQVSNDTILCSPQVLTFTANSSGTAESFVWSSNAGFSDTLNTSTADSTLTVTPLGTTTYYVKASNPGCGTMDSVTVFFVSGSLTISGDDSLCMTESTVLTANITIPGVTFDYVWSPSAILTPGPQDNMVTATPPTDTWVVVTASGSNGCFDKDSILIHVGTLGAAVEATASPSVVLPGQPSVLTATPPGYTYSWTPVSGLTNPTGQITDALVENTTVYTVSITDGICTRSTDVTVKVMEVACREPFLYVPNAFSPNGDTENDVLYVRSAITTEILFRVFDRWGELVFETTSLTHGWDGTFRGKPVDPDTYDYYLKAVCTGGQESIIKGNITLIR